MDVKEQTREQLLAENAELRARLEEAEDTLHAIRIGEVDALIVSGPEGDQLYTLKGAEEPYRILIEEMNQGAVTLSSDGTILYCNQRFAELVQTTPERAIGQTIQQIVVKPDHAQFRALMDLALAGRSLGEIRAQGYDGRTVPLQVALSKLSGNRAAALCLIATDLSDNKRKEAAVLNMMEDLIQAKRALETANHELADEVGERKGAEAEVRRLNDQLEERVSDRTLQLKAANQELEAFAYSVSHDLRAPVRHINGFIQCLAKHSGPMLTEKGRHYLEQIESSAREMGCLIDDLLVFSRRGREEMKVTRLELEEALNEALEQLQPEMKDRTIIWKRAPLPAVRCDPAMLRQVFINLLSNAVKYTRPRNPAEIEIGVAREDETEVAIFVRDNGVGFDMDYADKLFGVFQRLHADEEFEGTGIGLANVRRIITRHCGRTWAEGKVDLGATFFFSLPKSPSP